MLSGFDSPMTAVVTWCLLTPSRFFTSQTKVVFTASSTFRTISLLALICTVSGIGPDMLCVGGRGGVREREREERDKPFWKNHSHITHSCSIFPFLTQNFYWRSRLSAATTVYLSNSHLSSATRRNKDHVVIINKRRKTN